MGSRPPDPVVVAPEDVASPDASALRTAYAGEVSAVIGAHFVARPDGDGDLAPPDGVFWVARRSGVPVGCVGAHALDAATVELKRMYVSPAARGRGTGSRLLAAAEDWARARGASRVVLDTRGELEDACRLYRARGWVQVEPYNDNPDAQLWFAKALDERPERGG